MTRKPVGQAERRHGERLGRIVAERRQAARLSVGDIARRSAVSLDAVRSLENGRVPTPAFLTVARLADVLGLSLDDLHAQASHPSSGGESP